MASKRDQKTQDSDNENTNYEFPPPKRPLTAYILYTLDQRPKFLKKHPEWAGSEVVRKMAQRWNELSDEEREPYFLQQDKELERYHRQMEEYEHEGRYYDDEGNPAPAQRGYKRRRRTSNYLRRTPTKKATPTPKKPRAH